MLTAMNTGHDGSMSTGHANSAKDMLSRMESMVLMAAELPVAVIRSQIVSAVDVMVHLGRLPDRSRRVLEISEIEGIKDGEILLNPLFQFDTGENRLQKTGVLKQREKLTRRGICLPEGSP